MADGVFDCGRGWTDRCKNSRGKKCRCSCGGHNHGTNRQSGAGVPGEHQLEFEPKARRGLPRHAAFSYVSLDAEKVVIRDEGPWNRHMTVTNDASWVVEQIAERLNGRRLFYCDSEGQYDELVVVDGKFSRFAPGPNRAQLAGVA